MKKISKNTIKDLIFITPLLVAAVALFTLRAFGLENCPLHMLASIPCPACGISRAYLAMFHGELKSAFSFHPLFWLPPVMVILFFLRHNPKLKALYKHGLVWWIVLGLWILCYVVRLAFNLFPF